MFVLPATLTTLAQREVELKLLDFLEEYHPDVTAPWNGRFGASSVENEEEACGNDDSASHSSGGGGVRLHRELHAEYVRQKLLGLSGAEEALYNAQPWIAYWTLHAADVLGVTDELYERVSPDALGEFLLACLKEVKKDDGTNSRCGCGGREDEGEKQGSERVLLRRPGGIPDFGDDDDDGERLVGFSGGQIAQLPHLGLCYAAVCSLCILARPEYLRALPRAAIKRWILSMRNDDGSFCMHSGGEADIRGSYCAAVVAVLLQLDDVRAYKDGREEVVLTEQTAAFVASCQTHEGGFACGHNASEAHGAYTHCALASLMLMRHPHLCNYAALRRWLAARQLKFEGGFNGRTNKLVDSCYSYWVGVSHVLLRVGEAYKKILQHAGTPRCLTAREAFLLDHAQLIDATCIHFMDKDAWSQVEGTRQQRAACVEAYLQAAPSSRPSSSRSSSSSSFFSEDVGDFYFNQRRLLLYVLACCQNTSVGGLMDKPGYPNDSYHTCYSLSGMSAAQNLQYLPRHLASEGSVYSTALSRGYIPTERDGHGIVLATKSSRDDGAAGEGRTSPERLRPVNPIFNIHHSRVLAGLRAWGVKSILF